MYDDVIDLYENKLILLEKIPASILSAVTLSLMYKVKKYIFNIKIIFQFANYFNNSKNDKIAIKIAKDLSNLVNIKSFHFEINSLVHIFFLAIYQVKLIFHIYF